MRAAIGNIQLTKKPYKNGHEFARLLDVFLRADEDKQFRCPSQDTDQLFTTSADQTSPPTLIPREPRDESERTRVWYGNIGSGNSMDEKCSTSGRVKRHIRPCWSGNGGGRDYEHSADGGDSVTVRRPRIGNHMRRRWRWCMRKEFF